MISIREYNKEFIKRHDFIYDDLDYLPSKYSHISFSNIPEAWVFEIDRIISIMDYPDLIRSVSQVMGFLIVDYFGSSEFDKNNLHILNKNIEQLDIDLHNNLDAGIILN